MSPHGASDEKTAQNGQASKTWKIVSAVLLSTLVLGSLIVIIVEAWPIGSTPTTSVSSTATAADKEALLKDKIENYSKRADDLQKIASLFLGLSTIYAIALGVSAYVSVQGNTDRAKGLVVEAKESIDELRDLTSQFETLKNTTIKELRSEVETVRKKADYAIRMAIATMVSEYPPTPEGTEHLRKSTIQGLIELRKDEYATDRFLNLALARLYTTLKQFENSEDALTAFIMRAEQLTPKDNSAIASAYYDRACSQSLRWDLANDEEKEFLKGGITRDLTQAIKLDESCRRDARRPDPDFSNVQSLGWFTALLKS